MSEKVAPPKAFSWLKVIHESGMSGLTAMLASHSAPVVYDPAIPMLKLEIHKSMMVFAETTGIENVRSHLMSHFGPDLVLETIFGEASASPAMMSQERKIQRLKNACEVVMTDKFSTDVANEFGAKVIVESVKPLAVKKVT